MYSTITFPNSRSPWKSSDNRLGSPWHFWFTKQTPMFKKMAKIFLLFPPIPRQWNQRGKSILQDHPELTGLQASSVSTDSSSGRHSRASKYKNCCRGVNLPLQAWKDKHAHFRNSRFHSQSEQHWLRTIQTGHTVFMKSQNQIKKSVTTKAVLFHIQMSSLSGIIFNC